MKAGYLVCYDISDPARLNRIFRYLKGRGLHIQYSVFYCSLTWQELGSLKNKLSEFIDPKQDDIRIYPLPSDTKVTVMGCGDRIPEGANIFL